MAEGIFRHEMEKRGFENIMCQSAGLSALDGQHPSENAVLACKEIGVDIQRVTLRAAFTPERNRCVGRLFHDVENPRVHFDAGGCAGGENLRAALH